jgi:hypothetical protein
MKNLPDEIFRRKLEHLQTPPPARAWEKIEQGMRRKRITPWLAIAASLLLAITASALILTRQKESGQPQVADRQPPETNVTPDTSGTDEAVKPAENSSDASFADEPVPQAHVAPVVPDTRRDIPNETVAANTDARDVSPAEEAPDTSFAEEENTIADVLPAIDDSIPTLTADASDEVNAEPVKIVLDADEVQARYLKRKTKDDATDGVAKASGLRKLLDKAEQIQNQDPIGDLRQMKNEILALNFQGRKREQHK